MSCISKAGPEELHVKTSLYSTGRGRCCLVQPRVRVLEPGIERRGGKLDTEVGITASKALVTTFNKFEVTQRESGKMTIKRLVELFK